MKALPSVLSESRLDESLIILCFSSSINTIPFSFLFQECNDVDDIEFDYWVEIRDVIGSRTHFITFPIFTKLLRLKLVCPSSIPDPTKNETRQLSNHWDNQCNNFINDPTDVHRDFVYRKEIILRIVSPIYSLSYC